MDNRRDKDKKFDRAQAMDRLTQDDKDKISLIKMMLDKEKKSMKEVDVNVDDETEFKLDLKHLLDKHKISEALDQGEIALLRSLRNQIDQGVLNSKQKTAFVKLLDNLIGTNISERDIDKDEEFKDMKKENMYIDDNEFEMEMVVDRVKEIKPLFPGMDDKILVDFVNTHRQDIRGASDEDIKDEFEEFFSVNYETGADYMEEENIGVDLSDAAAGDDAIERESASGAFEESKNWRGETLKEQFKRLTK